LTLLPASNSTRKRLYPKSVQLAQNEWNPLRECAASERRPVILDLTGWTVLPHIQFSWMARMNQILKSGEGIGC
jgi:hypothetical protein